MGRFGTIEGEGTVARRNSVNDEDCSCYWEHIHPQWKAPEEHGVRVWEKSHNFDNFSHIHR